MPARARQWPDPRIKPPFGSVSVDFSHPLGEGLIWCLLFNEAGGPPLDLVRGRRLGLNTATGCGVTTNGQGLAGEQTDVSTSYWTMGTDTAAQAALPTESVTFAISRRNTTTAAFRATGGISNGVTSGTSEFALYLPYTDLTVYWDFGGSSSPNRINYAGGTKSLLIERHVAVAGRLGSALYLNGILKASQGTAITRVTNGNQVALGLSPNSEVHSQELNQVLLLGVEWPAELVRWWTAEPYAMLRPIVRRRYSVAAPVPSPSLTPLVGSTVFAPVGASRYQDFRLTPMTA